MEKGRDKDTLNLTFILLVDNYFEVGNFLSDPDKNVSLLGRCKEKSALNAECLFLFFKFRTSVFFFGMCGSRFQSEASLEIVFLIFVYFILFIHFFIYFLLNPTLIDLWKAWTLFSPNNGLNNSTTVLQRWYFGIK